MTHIVFQQADINALRLSFELENSVAGTIIEIKDDFAVGPLDDIYTPEGIGKRKQWWREVLAGGDYEGLVDDSTIDDNKTVSTLIDALQNNPDKVVWIWAAPNKHDVSGYYWLISQLKEFHERIYILFLNNLPFINEKGQLFYPVNLFDIPPKEFVKARKMARLVSLAGFDTDTEEWNRLGLENKGVRLLEGGKKLIQHDYSFYDGELINVIGTDWIKVNKLMHKFYTKAKHTTGDAYLLWRLKQLIVAGKLDARGEIRSMKEFEVRVSSQ